MKVKHLQEQIGKFEVKDPVSGQVLGTMDVVSTNTNTFRQRALKLFQDQKLAKDENGSKAAVAASLIIGWDEQFANEIEEPYTPEKALEYCSLEGMDWFLLQLETFTADPANFFSRT